MAIETLMTQTRRLSASETFKQNSTLKNSSLYDQAAEDRLAFWAERANDLEWSKKWNQVLDWDRPYAKWFCGGQLNASVNCLDVHIRTHRKNKAAIVWESEMGERRTYTYWDLYHEVNQFAYQLRHHLNVKKGDRVTIYMPMIPELAIAVLACARIGAIHSVVFGGFSADSLRDRIIDSGSKLVITADGGYRRGNILNIKHIVDQALSKKDTPVTDVIVVRRLGQIMDPFLVPNRDHDYQELIQNSPAYQEPEVMESEDILFLLYTSGTTGKPKGIIHTTGGYLTHVKYSTKTVFDLAQDDVYWCTADIGWITGHSYVIYGPLSNGATVVMYEGTPDYPDKDRFWNIIARHRVSILYTAPTAIRTFMKWGTDYPQKHDLSSLRLLGSVGEPINPEAWRWYHEHIGQGRCPIVDTWWQTETGGIMITNLPALNDMKPGFAGLPLPGIDVDILDETGIPTGSGGYLSVMKPWPGMLRGIWGDAARYKETYWDKFDTYFAGDGAKIDEDGYIQVLGRVDDVLNVSGHRISTMEVESTIVDFAGVAEAACVGMPDEIKGQAIIAFVTLKETHAPSTKLEAEIIQFVGEKIGAIAKPKRIIFTPELPKTRSGKIMRRLLKDIAYGQKPGDTTTLANPSIVEQLAEQF